MSAQLDSLPRYRRMTMDDLAAVLAIENAVYSHPWTHANFADSLATGYHCWVMEVGGETVGYGVLMIAAGESHLLNLSIAVAWQRRGFGGELLRFLITLARDYAADKIYLEVRPTNAAGCRLYARAGFGEIAIRRGYYPAANGREDAMVMELDLV